ncbi:MAG: ATP-binding cassette domain-containing protein, partial [Hyphomicrobiaceae bacterium]
FWSVYLGGDNDIERALEQFQLTALANIPVGYLSSGQRRRTALARLLAARRPLWLLDEPTVALDDVSRDALIAAGDSHLNEGGIIVAATHLPLPFERTQALRMGLGGETE